MSKISKTKSLNVFLVVIFSLFFVAVSLVAAKNITFLTDKLDRADFRGLVTVGTTTTNAALNIDPVALEKSMAINTGSGGISMNYTAINPTDVVNLSYLSSLIVPASKVSSGTFGSQTGNGDYVFPANATVTTNLGVGQVLTVGNSISAVGDISTGGDVSVASSNTNKVYKWNNQAGYNPHVGYSGGAVTTMVVGGGIILDMGFTQALTVNVGVINQNGTGSCTLTFTSGLLTAENCP